MIGHMDKCVDSRGQEYLTGIFNQISRSMGCVNSKQAVAAFRQMMLEMDLKNPVTGKRDEEINVLSHSVNPVRLKNNPIKLDKTTIKSIYEVIVA